MVAGSIAAIVMFFDRQSRFQQQNKDEHRYDNSDVKNRFNEDISEAVQKVYIFLNIPRGNKL